MLALAEARFQISDTGRLRGMNTLGRAPARRGRPAQRA